MFYPDLYSAGYKDKGHDGKEYEITLAAVPELEKLLQARKHFAYGPQHDYLDHPNCIGWTREGDDEHPGSGCAVLLSNSEEGFKKMEIGRRHAGKTFVDRLGHREEQVTIDPEGNGDFTVAPGSVSVWTATP